MFQIQYFNLIYYLIQTAKFIFKRKQMNSKQKKEFLVNLDLIASHSESEVYKKATPQKINEIIDNMGVFNEDGQKFDLSCSVSEFKKFGPGVYLMFKLLKQLAIIFGIMGVLSFVQFFLLIKSPFYQGYGEIVRMNLMRLTIASLQPESHQIYIFFDFLLTVVFLLWLIWWKQSEYKFVEQCKQVYKLPSYLTVVLDNLSENFSEQKLKQIIEKDGDIHVQQIYTAKYFGNKLQKYKKITQQANQFRLSLEICEAQLGQQGNKQQVKTMVNKLLQLQKHYHQINNQKFNDTKFKLVKAYIVLRYYSEKQRALQRYSITKNCLNNNTKEQNQQQIVLSPCDIEPDSIAWQNVGYPKWKFALRIITVLIILALLTCIGVILIFILEILQTAAIGDAYYFSQKQLLHSNQQQTHDYCLSLSPYAFLKQNAECSEFTPDYFKLTILILLTPFSIFVCKKTIMFFLSHFVHFSKYESEVKRIKFQITIISFFYFIVAAVLHLVLYLKAKNQSKTLSLYQVLYPLIQRIFSFANFNPASIHLYSDFSLQWYKQATFFIILIGSTSFNISNLWKLIFSVCSKKIQILQAKKQKSIFKVKQKLKGIHLHIQDVYASGIVIVYFVFLYFTAIPLIMVFGFINLTILYWVSKYVFISKSQRLLKMSHTVNNMVTYVLFGAILVHCIMAPIYLGAPGIAKTPKSYEQQHNNQVHSDSSHLTDEQIMTIGQRYAKIGGYYIAIIALMMIYLIIRKFLKNPIRKFLQKKQQSQSQNFENKKQFKGLYPSYSMHSNEKYNQILKLIYLLNKTQARRNTCKMDVNLKATFQEHKSFHTIKNKTSKTLFLNLEQPLFEKIINIIEKQMNIKIYEELDAQISQQLDKDTIQKLVEMFKCYDSNHSSDQMQEEVDQFSGNLNDFKSNNLAKQKPSNEHLLNNGDKQQQNAQDQVIQKPYMPAQSGSRLHNQQL